MFLFKSSASNVRTWVKIRGDKLSLISEETLDEQGSTDFWTCSVCTSVCLKGNKAQHNSVTWGSLSPPWSQLYWARPSHCWPCWGLEQPPAAPTSEAHQRYVAPWLQLWNTGTARAQGSCPQSWDADMNTHRASIFTFLPCPSPFPHSSLSYLSLPQVIENTCADLPIDERGEDEYTYDTEGQNMNDVGQKHLPLLVQAVFTLLIRYCSQSRDCRDHSMYLYL